MKLLITGVCGFAGSILALRLIQSRAGLELFGIDNFMRPGSEMNRVRLREAGVRVQHADLRNREDIETLPPVDWVIDAAANPSVLAGTTDNAGGARVLLQHNLGGTMNLLEYCRRYRAGFILLSTSRVYSIKALVGVRLEVEKEAFRPVAGQVWPTGSGPEGLTEQFSTTPPVSLYGATKLCSEALALEYGHAFGFPVWINRLGVLAGAGQFGKADQGVFSFWIHGCAAKKPLKFIGFGGRGYQVRDCLHPADVVPALLQQIDRAPLPDAAITNFSGGKLNSMSLRQLHDWCEDRFGAWPVEADPAERPFDVPWLVLDSAVAGQRFGWCPTTRLQAVLEEIARHATQNPKWLEWTTA